MQEKAETTHRANLKQNFVDKMPYDILLDEKFEEALEKLKKKNKELYLVVTKKILHLSCEPHIGKPLRNILKGKWRVHVGHYVLIYEIDDVAFQVVFLKIAHHDDAYR